MRELHVVALSEDGRSVLLATSKKATAGGFRLKLDDKIAAALRGDLPRPGESAVRASSVTPKEIQARMRAGESAEEIAASAGVPVARVERFAGPVLSERERIIDEARAAFLSRGRLGPSLLPLGDAVDAALAETPSLRPETVTWTARRLDSGHWLVQVSYVSRARTRTGSWVYDPSTRSLVASDPASGALGHAGEDATAKKPAAAPRAGALPVARKRKAAPRKASKAAKAPAKKAAAKKATPVKAAKKAAARPAAPAKAAKKVAKAPARKVAAKAAPKPAARKAPAAPKKVARVATPAAATPVAEVLIEPAVEPESPPTLRVVPTPPPPRAEPAEPPAEPAELTPTPKRRAAGERATVPDWADVLFGAAPRPDRNDD